MVSDRPRLIVEVLSESTQAVDQTIKLQEYMKIAGLIYIILVVPLAVDVQVWSRQDDASWTSIRYTTLSDVIPLPGLSIHLPLQQVYRRANVLQPDPLLEAEDE
jgi:Uma2 family endonuclease